MTAHTYRTQKYDESIASIRSMFLLMAILPMPAVIIMSALAYKQKPSLPDIAAGAGFLVAFIALLMTLPWIYLRGFRNLRYTIDDAGLTIRFLKTLHIPWTDILSIEKVNPHRIVGMRLCGLGWSVSHGLFSTDLGRAWIWLAGENEALFIKTKRRNYLLAPERLDEFMNLAQAHIRR